MSGARLTRLAAMSLTLGLAAGLVAPQARAQQPGPVEQPGPAQALPSPVAGRVLTLKEAIDIALATQPNIKARLGDYAAAQQRVYEALSALLPQFGAAWTSTRSQSVLLSTSPTTGATTPIKLTRDFGQTSTPQTTFSQLVFDFGQASAATDAAKSNAQSSKEAVEIERDTTTLNVKQAYFNLLFGQRLVKVNREAVARADLNLRSAKGFYEVGTQPKFTVTRAEVDVANAQLALIQAQNAAALARVALNTAMGIPIDSRTEIQDILAYEPFAIDESRLLAEALGGRPEYRQIKAQVDAAEATVRQTFRNFFPVISTNAFYGAQTADYNENWQVGLSLNWSIFDGGNKIARYKEAKANLDATQYRVRALELSIWQEVEQARLNVVAADQQIQAAKKAVESAQENFRLAQGRFDAGVGTIIELTDAQLALTQAQSTEAQALTNHRIAIAQLEKALGRR